MATSLGRIGPSGLPRHCSSRDRPRRSYLGFYLRNLSQSPSSRGTESGQLHALGLCCTTHDFLSQDGLRAATGVRVFIFHGNDVPTAYVGEDDGPGNKECPLGGTSEGIGCRMTTYRSADSTDEEFGIESRIPICPARSAIELQAGYTEILRISEQRFR